MPGPYREVQRVRCRGGVKTPPYEGKIQWWLALSGGPGMPGPYGDVE